MRKSKILSILASAALACGVIGNTPTQPAKATGPAYNFIMNWFPEPEEGGYYEAQRLNLYQNAGINSTIEEFGYATKAEQYVLSGRATFGMSNSDQVLEYNARGANFVAVMNTFQTSPIGILWHANDATVHTLADLSNHTLIYTFGATYEKYLIGRYHYANFKTRNDDFTSRAFAADPTAVQQCFVTSEPYLFTKQGLKVKYALIYDTGFRPYGSVIFTTRQFATAHPDVVRKFVAASVRGWYSYLKDPSAINAYLLTAPGAKNYFETPEEQTFSFTQMKRLHLVDGGDAAVHGIGWFNVDRWKTLQTQMSSVGIKVGGVDVNQAFTDQFLPASHPAA